MFEKLYRTDDNIVGFIARLALGIVILPHGMQKLLGMFGGGGVSGTLQFFTGMGVPAVFGFLVIIAESFGSLGLILGFLTRVGAFGITLVMAGATFMVHSGVGFFMNWSGQQGGEGFEFHLLAIGLGIIIMKLGGGRWSIDRLLTERQAADVKIVEETKVEHGEG